MRRRLPGMTGFAVPLRFHPCRARDSVASIYSPTRAHHFGSREQAVLQALDYSLLRNPLGAFGIVRRVPQVRPGKLGRRL
jgi:hypothetical protein